MASGFLRTGGCSLVGNRLLVLNVTDGYPKSLGSCAKKIQECEGYAVTG